MAAIKDALRRPAMLARRRAERERDTLSIMRQCLPRSAAVSLAGRLTDREDNFPELLSLLFTFFASFMCKDFDSCSRVRT